MNLYWMDALAAFARPIDNFACAERLHQGFVRPAVTLCRALGLVVGPLEKPLTSFDVEKCVLTAQTRRSAWPQQRETNEP